MRYRVLGRTGLRVSEIGFGCGPTAGLMTSADESLHLSAVARALELGINYFDTAAAYGNGTSERHLGRALRQLQAAPIVATKLALQWGDLGDIAGSVIRSVEGSCERLGLDALDVVFLHNRVGARRAERADVGSGALLAVDDVLSVDGVLGAFEQLRRGGRIRFVGCCAFGGETPAVERLIDSGSFDAVLVNYSLLNPSACAPIHPRAELRDYGQTAVLAAARSMGIVALRVLEGGLLAGSVDARPDLRSLPATGARDLAEAAVRFVLSNPQVSTALLGFSDLRQIDAAAEYAALGAMPPETLASIEAWQMLGREQ